MADVVPVVSPWASITPNVVPSDCDFRAMNAVPSSRHQAVEMALRSVETRIQQETVKEPDGRLAVRV